MAQEALKPQDLFRRGVAALREGRPDAAERLIAPLMDTAPDNPRLNDLMARIRLRQSRLSEAESFAHEALRKRGGALEFHDTLSWIMLKAGRGEEALAQYLRAAEKEPGKASAAYGAALMLAGLGRNDEALDWLRRAQKLAPDIAGLRMSTVKLLYKLERYSECLKEVDGALRLNGKIPALHSIAGRCLLALNHHARAAEAISRAVELGPDERENYVVLSAAYNRAGEQEKAAAAAAKFIERFPSLTIAGRKPEANVLVLGGLGFGVFSQPLRGAAIYHRGNAISQLRAGRFTFHLLYVDHPDPALVASKLGPIDLVYNNMVNAEIAERKGYTSRIRQIVDRLGVPVINAPEAVELTARYKNAEFIPARFDADFPLTRPYHVEGNKLEGLVATIQQDMPFPLLIRNSESHGDDKVSLVRDPSELAAALASRSGRKIYAIEYLGKEFCPGVFRKIRAVIIDRKFYPVRVDFSPVWNAHRYAEQQKLMCSRPDLMDNEKLYLSDPVGYLGVRNIEILESLAREYDLDFLGIDFDLREGGRMLIFEANPAMNTIENRQVTKFPYFADYWRESRDALESLILRRAGKA